MLAIVLWIPNINVQLTAKSGKKSSSITKDAMTWWISLYMCVQSLLFYCFVAWFATIVQSYGFDKATAGYFNSAYLLLGIPGSMLVPALAGKKKNQSGMGIILGLIYIIGLISMLFAGNKVALCS
ncbi:MAG: hypothetical protein K6A90_11590 [Lachnospiraceae bacterium]|nr:hypothetical protein [Lachnospiraceae bacterium]